MGATISSKGISYVFGKKKVIRFTGGHFIDDRRKQ
jgi:hypothetical protein